MANVDTTTPVTVAEQGAYVAPSKASSKKQATAKKGAPKARKPANGVKPKKPVSKTTKAHPGSKSAKVLELLARTNGASLAELMKVTEWQGHSVRGFLSTASRKRGVTIESFKSGKGERIYRVKK
jgi:Protein of unknown function (DUF3489)